MLTKTSRDLAQLRRGVAEFERTGSTSQETYFLMRHLHARTRGRSSDWIADATGREATVPDRAPGGILDALSPEERGGLLSGLRRDGFAVSPRPLPEHLLAELRRFALETPAPYLEHPEVGGWSASPALFDPVAPRSNRYQFRLPQMTTCGAAMELALDESIGALARDYLRCDPILDLVTMWWSAPGPAHMESAAAQRFHFDLDRSRFVKAFVYLTDVGPENGPHCYVRGSHSHVPADIQHDGRFDDALIARAFGQDAITTIEGAAGTVFFADTRGIHKGLPCRSGHRLIFQLEFSCSLFGGPLNRVAASTLSHDVRERVAADPHRFSGIVEPA